MNLPMFRGHPPGLLVCAATEMWERFSYYGMRALLIFYLTEHFRFDDPTSFAIYGAYSALVYMAPIVGGFVADQWLGGRRAVMFGGVLLMIGHLGMTIESSLPVFYLALAFIVAGVGFLKTSTNAIVGALYPPGDRRLDAGYTAYYMAYNLGGALSPLVCGWLGQRYGWGWGFGAAAVGMAFGLVAFWRGQHLLEGKAEPPNPARLVERVAGLPRVAWVYLGSIGFVGALWLLLMRREVVGPMLSAIGLATGGWLVYYAVARCTRIERNRLLACAILIVFTVGFWAFYEQMGSSLALFSDRVVDRAVLGYEIPASVLQSIPSIFVIGLAPGFVALWLALGRRGREPSTAVKFVIAIGTLAVGFLALAAGTAMTAAGDKVSLGWFILNFFLLVVGELCLAPVGISMVAQLAPKRIVAVMMGAFLLAYSGASYLAGLIATLASIPASAVADADLLRATYGGVFLKLGIGAAVVAVVLAALAPLLRRLVGEAGGERVGDAA
ncbi:MAG: peptide MFS transporter [Gemmatimonadetes bacterium]|nr:peptide MFS transporter [Gemmatimonadota bacterium]